MPGILGKFSHLMFYTFCPNFQPKWQAAKILSTFSHLLTIIHSSSLPNFLLVKLISAYVLGKIHFQFKPGISLVSYKLYHIQETKESLIQSKLNTCLSRKQTQPLSSTKLMHTSDKASLVISLCSAVSEICTTRRLLVSQPSRKGWTISFSSETTKYAIK